MRTISGGGLAKLATKLGTEPIFIVEVDWNGESISYADRDVAGIPGRIQEVGALDNVVDVTNNNSSQSISVTLSDTDGSIKDILDHNDVHQRNVWVYQYFDGLDLSDKFLLFQGKLSTPVTWSEADRTVTFTIISQLEDKEFGFSAEEGDFTFIPKDLIGKTWPSIFGKVLDVPALQVNKAVSGTTLCGVGIISGASQHNAVPIGASNCGLGMSLAMMSEQISIMTSAGYLWAGFDKTKADGYLNSANALRGQMEQAVAGQFLQQQCAQNQRAQTVNNAGLGCNPVGVLGGEDFPQNQTIEINIGGGLFTGHMVNDRFFISSRRHPENEAAAQTAFHQAVSSQCPQVIPNQVFDLRLDVPAGSGNFGDAKDQIRQEGFIICTDESTSQPSASQVAQQFWADAGSNVVLSSDEPISYIVSITPGTVLAVKAYKQFDGIQRLVNVPNDLWDVRTVVYGTVTAIEVVVHKPLSTIVDQGWSDDLYVTFESTIGPNTVDILKYIIDNYTDLTWDPTTFNAAHTTLAQFPMNFPVLDRKNTIDIIKEIAFQARCAVWISNSVFYIKYLPAEPDANDTITVTDIQNKSLTVELTPTEDLVTKMVVTWRLSYAEQDPEKIILRHNVNKYGTKEQEYDFYCFNQPDIVLKAATFWLIRNANTWKKVKFQTLLSKLNLETFDCVNLDFAGGYVATGAVKAIVEQASYNSADDTVDFTCWTPVKAGTLEKYKFAWPQSLTISDVFPTPEEIAAGNAGGSGIGAGATGQLPIGYTGVIGTPGLPISWLGDYDNGYTYAVNDAVLYNQGSYICVQRSTGNSPANPQYWRLITANAAQGGTVFVGGPNVIFFGQSDRGDSRPGDTGFSAQTIIPQTVYAEIQNTARPSGYLPLNYASPLPIPLVPQLPSSGFSGINIKKTKFFDPDVKAHNGLFHFEWDDAAKRFGAGTAFFRDKTAEEEAEEGTP